MKPPPIWILGTDCRSQERKAFPVASTAIQFDTAPLTRMMKEEAEKGRAATTTMAEMLSELGAPEEVISKVEQNNNDSLNNYEKTARRFQGADALLIFDGSAFPVRQVVLTADWDEAMEYLSFGKKA